MRPLPAENDTIAMLRDLAFEVERLRMRAREAGSDRLALSFELALHEIGAEMGKRGLPFVAAPCVAASQAGDIVGTVAKLGVETGLPA